MTDAAALSTTDRALLAVVYELMSQRGSWPTFTAVDLRVDRELGIEDAQAALATVPEQYIFRSWHSNGFYDADEVRLRLRGVAECKGGPADLALLERLVAWVVELERNDTGGPEDDLIATGQAFAEHLGITLETVEVEDEQVDESSEDAGDEDAPATQKERRTDARGPEPSTSAPRTAVPQEIAEARAMMLRVRVLADLLPTFWSGAGWQNDTPWQWQYTVDRKRLRPYRHVQNLNDLFAYVDSVERDRLAAAAAARSASAQVVTQDISWSNAAADAGMEYTEPPTALPPSDGAELDILLTLVREEIADSAAELVRANQFDEAIFAAMRRVEHELQQRAENTQIGDPLVKYAFRDSATPIRISERGQDNDRMIELFCGAIGLLKGDRSHKDRPTLPCRSRRECMRVLAHASSLLDLLDRDIDRAPRVRGYEHHQGDTLTLWVERAGAQVDVWLDGTVLLEKISFRAGTLVVSLAGVSIGEHRIHLVEGTRQGTAQTVWITRAPGSSSWYRVSEVNIPLYADASGQQQLDVAGVRLLALESGVTSERIYPTRQNYQVGHYVDWHWSNEAIQETAWAYDRAPGPPRVLPIGGALFDGQPIAPAHAERLMGISIEPNHLRLRGGDKVPLRVLGHYTDGVATWNEPLDDPDISTGDEKIAMFRGGAVFAKDPGITVLRCLYSGQYAEARVAVAAHPRGTMTEYITGLPPVSGLAWTPDGLVVSVRDERLWRVGADGVYRLAAAIAPLPTASQGPDNIFARDDGELAVRLLGTRSILVLHHGDGYRSSHWVEPAGEGNPKAFVWDGDDLIVAMHTGAVYRVDPTGSAGLISTLDAHPVDIVRAEDALLVLCGPGTRRLAAMAPPGPGEQPKPPHHRDSSLWRIPLNAPDYKENLLGELHLADLNGVLWTGSQVVLSEFQGGRLLSLHDGQMSPIASGLTNPGQLTASDKGEIYVAEFGAGSIQRIFG